MLAMETAHTAYIATTTVVANVKRGYMRLYTTAGSTSITNASAVGTAAPGCTEAQYTYKQRRP